MGQNRKGLQWTGLDPTQVSKRARTGDETSMSDSLIPGIWISSFYEMTRIKNGLDSGERPVVVEQAHLLSSQRGVVVDFVVKSVISDQRDPELAEIDCFSHAWIGFDRLPCIAHAGRPVDVVKDHDGLIGKVRE